MRNLRILLAAVLLIASMLWLILGTGLPAAEFSERFQIIPSAIQSCLATTVVWIIATLIFGRVYCSTVCPVGTLIDITVMIRRKSDKRFKFRFQPANSARYGILFAYLVSLVAGVVMVGFVIEPWNMMRNAASCINPADTAMTWGRFGISVGVGAAAGIAVLLLILIWSWRSGRAFCTSVCPLGTLLGCVHTQTLFHFAIDPDKCVSCMKCEDVCPSKCIKVETRLVDNSRCVCCFECTDVCPNDAIRCQINKNRNRQTPLLNPS